MICQGNLIGRSLCPPNPVVSIQCRDHASASSNPYLGTIPSDTIQIIGSHLLRAYGLDYAPSTKTRNPLHLNPRYSIANVRNKDQPQATKILVQVILLQYVTLQPPSRRQICIKNTFHTNEG
ncbi:hypothetical protein BDV10DRAFT_172840 [Aspergillus recurvatus]